jgi:ribosomal protein L9
MKKVKITNNSGEEVEVSEAFAKAFNEAQKHGIELTDSVLKETPDYKNDIDIDD